LLEGLVAIGDEQRHETSNDEIQGSFTAFRMTIKRTSGKDLTNTARGRGSGKDIEQTTAKRKKSDGKDVNERRWRISQWKFWLRVYEISLMV
jgi:hypothetical protein